MIVSSFTIYVTQLADPSTHHFTNYALQITNLMETFVLFEVECNVSAVSLMGSVWSASELNAIVSVEPGPGNPFVKRGSVTRSLTRMFVPPKESFCTPFRERFPQDLNGRSVVTSLYVCPTTLYSSSEPWAKRRCRGR